MVAEDKQRMVPLDEAAREVQLSGRRLGLLHLAYAKTLVQVLGEVQGTEVILKAIKHYGKLVGEEAKEAVEAQGLETTPQNFDVGTARSLPMYGNDEGSELLSQRQGLKHSRVYGCTMGKVWLAYGEEKLGSLYCYVDPAKYMYYNPDYKMVHRKNMLVDGGNCCEFEVQRVTDDDKRRFFSKGSGWIDIDK